MFRETAPGSRSVSSRGTSRNRLGKSWISEEIDSHPSLEEDDKKHDRSIRKVRSSLGSLWFLIPLLVLLATDNKRHLILDSYIPATVYGLFICGLLLLCVSFGTALCSSRLEREEHPPYAISGQTVNRGTTLGFVKLHANIALLLVGAVTLRIVLQTSFVSYEQCLVPGIEGILPLLYVFWNARPWFRNARLVVLHPENFTFARNHTQHHVRQDIQSAILLGLSAWTASYMVSYPRSTMICESSLAAWMLFFQFLSVILDLCILLFLEKCLDAMAKADVTGQAGWTFLVGVVCLTCGPLVLIFSLAFRLPIGLEALETFQSQEYAAFAWELLIILLFVLFAGSLLSASRVMTLLSACTVLFVIFSVSTSLSNKDYFSFVDYAQALLALACISGAFKIHQFPLKVRRGRSDTSAFRIDYILYLIPILAAVTILFTAFPSLHMQFQNHPIDALILAADQAHEAWAAQAKQSQSLHEAVVHYRKRYNRQPPPNFHIWYNFAIARDTDILDDFDNIERDLAPFRALTPADLRASIREAADDTFNEIGIIKIRKGVPSVDKRFEGHAWMMDVMVLMMEYFISCLPDMDIPFNINDEPRVVIPYEQMQQALSKTFPPMSSATFKNWSSNTGDLLDQPLQAGKVSSFEDWSFKNNFKKYSTLGCPPYSAARQTKYWHPSRLCLWCSKSHSRLDFVEDWNQTSDPCHQPDLETLHGFYQGPGAYKVTTRILPIFSTSKPQGYADILYPSIWAWDDGQRARYAPNKEYPAPGYVEKLTTLFWRGSTTEGFATQGKWRTFSRQRFVYMTNQATQSIPVYLPAKKGSRRYRFESLTKNQFLRHPLIKSSQLNLDTGFTAIEKATDDFDIESRVFAKVENEDFQVNWQHKYLMSLDEGSASRNFIPFVQSNSLPFRATIFHEWFDDRLTAWKHFVPIDVRFRGLWSTLAYFAGGFGTTRSTDGMDAGEYIAESGKLWGSRTLRRDDMEIYLFRLLLEWGRLLDDSRDELGFQL